MKSRTIVFITIIFLVTIFFHFYKLTVIPPGLNQDETAIGYNAYSILQTGKDEYSKSYPAYFKSFGDQKLPVYIYLTSVSELVFGVNAFAVRFPSAFLGAIGVILLFLFVLEISQNENYGLLAAVFFALNPWHLFFSRAAFEDNIALTFILFGIVMLLKAFKKNGSLLFALPALFGFILSFYSYNVTRFLSPLLLFLFIGLYWHDIKRIPLLRIIAFIAVGFVLALPFLLTAFSRAGVASASGALLTSADIKAQNLEFRSYVIGMPHLVSMIFFNNLTMTVWKYLQNIISYFSTSFFFISGSDHGTQGIGNVGQFYVFEFPFVIGGMLLCLKQKKSLFRPVLYWAVLVLLVASLSKLVPHATRGYFLVVPLSLFSSYGFYTFLLFLARQKKFVKTGAYICLALVVCLSVLYYFSSYYFRFPVLYASEWREQDKPLSLYLQSAATSHKTIVIDPDSGFIYTSYLFYTKYPPTLFQETVQRYPDDTEGFSAIKSFGNFEFRSINSTDNAKNTLYVMSPNKEANLSVIQTFLYPERPVVIALKEIVYQYPTTDKAYVIQTSQ